MYQKTADVVQSLNYPKYLKKYEKYILIFVKQRKNLSLSIYQIRDNFFSRGPSQKKKSAEKKN